MTATGELIAALTAGGMNVAEAAGLVARAAVEMTGAVAQKREPTSAAARMNEYRNRREAMGMPRVFRADQFRPILVERDGERCIYCETSGPLVIDHIHPTFLGGNDDHGNLGLACKECNGRKAGKPFVDAGMSIVVQSAKVAHADYLARTQANTGEHSNGQDCSQQPRTNANNREHNEQHGCSQMFAQTANTREHVHSASLSKEEKKEEVKEKREGARGCRLPDGWEPLRADLDAASALLGATRADDELAKFRDHWKAQPGSRGVKADWPATWRNWYRRAAEYGSRNGQSVSNNRADPAAGRATAREVQQVTTVGSAALRYLKEGNATRSSGSASSGAGPAGFFDTDERAKNAH